MESGLDSVVCGALLADAEETRPRCDAFEGGVLLNFRGINLNPGADPADMVSIRVWIDGERIVSSRARPLKAMEDIRSAIAAGTGPKNPADVIVELTGRLVKTMSTVLAELDDRLDRLEDTVLSAQDGALQVELSAIRREAIGLRRYIAPQREAMSDLMALDAPRLDQMDRERLREVPDRITRYVEDLEAARERAVVIQDDLANRLARNADRTMYLLAIVAVVFLPLGLITDLFEVGVERFPGAETPWAFGDVCTFLLVLAGFEVWLFRRLKWI